MINDIGPISLLGLALRRDLVLHFLRRRFPFALFYAFPEGFLTLAQGFRQLRESGCTKKQKDHEHDYYKLRGSESGDRQHCLTHNFLFLRGRAGLWPAILDCPIRRTGTSSKSRPLYLSNA
jgi:hypothetical protein